MRERNDWWPVLPRRGGRERDQGLRCREERWGWGDREEKLEAPEVILSDLGLLHQVSSWTGDEQGKEVGGIRGVFQIWLSNWPRIPQTLKKASRPSYANVWPESPLPPERSPPQGVPVGSPGSSLISILNWTKIHCHFHLHQLSFSLKLGSQRASDLSRSAEMVTASHAQSSESEQKHGLVPIL